MRLYGKYLQLALKAQLEYPGSFLLLTLSQTIFPLSMLVGVHALFSRFGSLGSWTFPEVALCFGIIHLAFGLSECFSRGFDTFSTLVRTGRFDQLLVRPQSTAVQVLGSRFEFNRIGRIVQGFLVLGWALTQAGVVWTIPKVVTVILMVISGYCLFTGFFILQATLSFWTIQGLEIGNILADGGRELAQYPISIYRDWVVRFFTWVVPIASINYLPLLYLLDRTEGSSFWYMLSPAVGILFLIPCLALWHLGVKHYQSTGS